MSIARNPGRQGAQRRGPGLRIIPTTELSTALAERAGALAVVRHGGPVVPAERVGALSIHVGDPELGDTPSSAEVWFGEGAVRRGHFEALDFAESDDLLMASATVRALGVELEEETYALYHALFRVMEQQGKPHLLRLWNHIPAINEEVDGLERYRRFNRGRARAFEDHFGPHVEERFPSSSGVGSAGEQLVLYALAAKHPGQHRGNPRQMHAYRYPATYGPKSPSFARGTLLPPELGGSFLISGTASIVGHETVWKDDVVKQVDETVENIRVLIEDTASVCRTELGGLEALEALRVYVRHAEDFDAVRARLDALVPRSVPRVFTHADICRHDLLVEIEGIVGPRT